MHAYASLCFIRCNNIISFNYTAAARCTTKCHGLKYERGRERAREREREYSTKY